MHVLMMLVVNMRMIVLHRFVSVLMFVPLAHVKPNSDRHQSRGDDERCRRPLSKNNERYQRADEWRSREISSRTRGTELPQREDECDQAHPVTQKSEYERPDYARRSRQTRAE